MRGLRISAMLVAGLLLAVALVVAPQAVARGWFVAFLLLGSAVLGGLALRLMTNLTAARWAEATGPLAAAAPGLVVLWAGLLPGLGAVYPWVFGPAPDQGHAAVWFSPGFFAVRQVMALVAWGAIGAAAAAGRLAALGAGLVLLLHAALVCMAGQDWVLSIRPGWVASDFGMNFAAQQLGAGSAAAILLAPAHTDERALRDLTSILVAAGLGVAYLAFMNYLVVWYGDLPDRVGWYLERRQGIGPWLAGAALVGAAALPIVAAAPRLSRRTKSRLAAVIGLAALFVYELYLTFPVLGWAVVATAAPALLLQGLALSLLAGAAPWKQPKGEAAYG